MDASRFADVVREQAERARADAERSLAGRAEATTTLVEGAAQAVIRREIESFAPTVVALGGRNRSRFLGALLGETASMLLHDASTSVLLARPARGGGGWTPSRVVVGVDGSGPSLAALAAADEIVGRLGGELSVVAARGGKPIDDDPAWAGRVTDWAPDAAHHALRERSATADLVVVGSRGAHGVKALGSVSERVAHGAQCSVLVVRA